MAMAQVKPQTTGGWVYFSFYQEVSLGTRLTHSHVMLLVLHKAEKGVFVLCMFLFVFDGS